MELIKENLSEMEKCYKGCEIMKQHFYNSKEVMDLLTLNSLRTAQLRIKAMNDELLEKGFWIERGKVPVQYFHEKYPYIEKESFQ